ncbi:MAG: hypothetical protein EBU08_00595 [Micrococcales bacterium]|nr:hypothetical protein [Micrococcales bacterium]
MSLSEIFEKDADALTVQDDQLAGIAGLAKRAKVLEKEIEELETVVKERKDSMRKLLEETIPAALQEMGMKSFKMGDGSSIEIKPFYGASIPEARRAEAYESSKRKRSSHKPSRLGFEK